MNVDMVEKLGGRVRVLAEAAPEELLANAIHDSVGELCDRSAVWRERLPSMDVFKGIADYEVNVPHYAALIDVMQVYWDGNPLPFRDIDSVRSDTADATTPSSNTPGAWTMPWVGTVRLIPAVNEDKTDILRAYGAIRPAADTRQMPDWMLRWAEGIASGAVARLIAIPGKPWSAQSAAEVQFHQRNFESAVGEAARMSVTGFRGHKAQTNDISYFSEL